MKRPDLITSLKKVLDAIDSLSVDDIGRLSDPNYLLEIKLVRKKPKTESLAFEDDLSVETVIAEITIMASRLEALELLASRYPTKKGLEGIARKLDIPILKKDKVEDLRGKIVEATVGAKIRSQAIQGSGS